MSPPPARRLAVVGLAVAPLLAACWRTGAARPPAPPPPPSVVAAESLPAAIARADSAVTAGRWQAADSLLGDFLDRWPGTPAAADARFRRAVLRLDPDNPLFSTRDGIADLEAYRAGGPLLPRQREAGTLRRLALQGDSLRAAIAYRKSAAVQQPAPAVPRDSLRVRDDSIAKLGGELDRTRAELERLRRRLAPPRP